MNSTQAQTIKYKSIISHSEITKIVFGDTTDTNNTLNEKDSISETDLISKVCESKNYLVEPVAVPEILSKQRAAFQDEGLVIVISNKVFFIKAWYDNFGKFNVASSREEYISQEDIKNCSMLVVGVKQN